MKKHIFLFLCICIVLCMVSCQKPNESEMPEWKISYLELIESRKDVCTSYALVYVDDDDIPELYLKGYCEAEGDSICSYKNGSVIEQKLNRIGGGRYVERSGKIVDQNGNMGVFCTNVYELTENGFIQCLEALSIQHVQHLGDEDYAYYYDFSVNGNIVSEYEHDTAIYASFDSTRAVKFDENDVSYDLIKQQLTDY